MEPSEPKKKTPDYKKHPLARIVSVREIISADYLLTKKLHVTLHTHPDAWEICFCQQGAVDYTQNERTIRLQAGQVLFTAPGTAHDSVITDPDTVSFYIAFTCTDTYLQNLRQRRIRVNLAQEQLLNRLIEELKNAFELKNGCLRIYSFTPGKNSPLGAEQMVCCYLEQFLISVLRELTAQSGQPVTGENLAEALESDLADRINRFIDRHLQEPITVERLCREFHYGRTKIINSYKRAAGVGINAYLTQKRMEAARRLLEEGELTVAQISEQTGFSSSQYFSRRFSALNGCSPTEYAQRFRKQSGEGN